MYALNLNSAFDPRRAGGKASRLAQAMALGMRVPPGFVILQESLKLFLVAADLYWRVHHYLQDFNPLKLALARQQFSQLCASAQAAPIPALVMKEIEPLAVDWLANAPAGLAVRSSSANEDLPNASFAGIYDSFLGVNTLPDLWEKIVRCWCSAWSPRAVLYARKMGIHLQPDQMAVIVQTLVPADRSGVIFTADPLSGNPWRFVLNATYGLAQKLVEGRAPADRCVLAWDSGQILEVEIVAKPSALTGSASGLSEIPLPAQQQLAPVLTGALAGKLAQMALALDRAFDQRVDIEWAEVGGEISLIQARPIPALPAFFPHQLSEEEAGWTWTPEEPAWYGSIAPNERLVAPLFRHRWALELWERRSQPDDIFPHKTGFERDFNGCRYTTAWRWYGHGHDHAGTEAWLDAHEAALRDEWLAQLDRVRQANLKAARLQASAQRAKDLIPGLLEQLKQEEEMQAAVWHAPQWLVFTCENLLKAFLEENAPGYPIGDLLQGLPCYSSARTAAAQDLGRTLSEDFVLAALAEKPLKDVIPWLLNEHPGCQFLQNFEAFCWEYGMVPPGLPEPWSRWGQDASAILFIIKASALGQAQDARRVLAACARQRKESEERVREIIRQIHLAQVGRFDKLLAWAQFWVPTLDDRKWHVTMSLRLAGLLYRAGSLLVTEGLMDKPTDLLLLTPEDLTSLAQADDATHFRQRYLSRKHDYETNRRLAPLPFLGKPPTPEQPLVTAQPDTAVKASLPSEAMRVYQGQGFAPGQASGITRKVPDLNNPSFLDALSGEDILVCPKDSENDWWRRDWLSLFMVVKGLVTVQGAQLHHATQIARECGVPFVNLPEDDYDSLPDNTRVTLDGSAGTVTLQENTLLPQWAPRVKQSLVRRLYELDAHGIYDEELIDEVGWGLYFRCQSFITAVEAFWGRVKCPACGEVFQHKPGPQSVLVCPACTWKMPWRDYFKTIQHKQLSGDAVVVAMFQDYINSFTKAHDPRQKMVLIDQLIHTFHENLKSGARRAAAVNLIEGSLHEVIEFLDKLSYGENSTPGVQQSHAEWQRKVTYIAEVYKDEKLRRL